MDAREGRVSRAYASRAWSLAKDLVFWVAQGAAARGVPVAGENALAGGVTSDHGWDNIADAFTWASYSGLTVLRIGEVTDNPVGRSRYQDFIRRFRQ